jgi:hypothetical protein
MRTIVCPKDDARAREVIDELYRAEATQRQRRRFGGWKDDRCEGTVEKIDESDKVTLTVPVALKMFAIPSALAVTIAPEDLANEYLYVRTCETKRPFEFHFCTRRFDGFPNTLLVSPASNHSAVQRAAKETIASFVLRVNNAFEIARSRMEDARAAVVADQAREFAIAELRKQHAMGK